MTTISTPCPEDWNAMAPGAVGRRCDRCARVVIDLTRVRPSEAVAVLHGGRDGDRVCIRARATTDGRVLLPRARRRLLTNGIAAVLALTTAGCGVPPESAQPLTMHPVSGPDMNKASHPAPFSPTPHDTGLEDPCPDEGPAIGNCVDQVIMGEADVEDPARTIMGDIALPPPPGIPISFPSRIEPPNPRTNG